MNDNVKILGIAGSLRSASYNRAALVAAQGLLEDGVTLELFDLEGLPLFNQDKEG
jgi:chromate reductase